jgi:hypothetical protein
MSNRLADRSLAAFVALAAVIIAYQWVLCLGVVPAAFAQTVDVRPVADTFVQTALGTLATVLSVLGGFAIRWFTVRTGLDNSTFEKDLNERLDFIIHKGYEFALLTYQNEMAKRGSGLTVIKLDNYMLKLVAEYVMPKVTGILAHFSISVQTETGRRKVEEMILARAPSHFNLETPSPKAVDGGVSTSMAAMKAEAATGAPGTKGARLDPDPFTAAPGTPG